MSLGKKGLIKAGRARAELEGVRRQKLWDPGGRWGRKLLCLQDLDDPIDNRRDGLVVEVAGAIKNQVETGRKEPVWPDIDRLVQCSVCKVKFGNNNRVAITDRLARDFTEDDIISSGGRN